jgi:protein-tyrosine phosphatase
VNFSEITENLWIGTTPGARDYDMLRRRGVKLVINMRFGHGPTRDPGEPPLDNLWLRTFDSPILPIPVRALTRGVQAALEVMSDGGKVYTHCARGRHRSVAMGAAILIAQGLSPDSAMSLIKARRSVADPYIFYIRRRITLFARNWTLSR